MRFPLRVHLLSRDATRRVLGCLALAQVLLLAAGVRGAQDECDADVVVVLSSRAEAIVRAGEGVREQAAGRAVVMTLDEFSRACEIDTQRIYVGVGPSAGLYLTDAAPAGATVGVCLVPNPHTIGVGDGVRLVGVNTTVEIGDQLAVLKRAVPSAERIGVLHRGSSSVSRDWLARLRDEHEGLDLVLVDLDDAPSVSSGISDLMELDVDAVWTFPDPAVYDSASVRLLLISSLRERVPVFGFSGGFVRAGALIGVEIDPASQGRQLAALLAQASDSGMTIEPCRLEYALNLVVAERLGLRVPKGVREGASVVFD
ncbi:MAG: ABC transporter substrate-binding protein [Phycisphaerales bacterium JB040]